jgi:hypothetical protein
MTGPGQDEEPSCYYHSRSVDGGALCGQRAYDFEITDYDLGVTCSECIDVLRRKPSK